MDTMKQDALPTEQHEGASEDGEVGEASMDTMEQDALPTEQHGRRRPLPSSFRGNSFRIPTSQRGDPNLRIRKSRRALLAAAPIAIAEAQAVVAVGPADGLTLVSREDVLLSHGCARSMLMAGISLNSQPASAV